MVRMVLIQEWACEDQESLWQTEARIINSEEMVDHACLKCTVDYAKPGNPRLDIQLPKTELVPGLIFKSSFHLPLKITDSCHS